MPPFSFLRRNASGLASGGVPSFTALLNDLSHQIVIMRLSNLAPVEFARNGIHSFRDVGNVQLAIDFWRMHWRTAFEQQIALLGNTFEQDIKFFPAQRLLFAFADGLLNLHQV